MGGGWLNIVYRELTAQLSDRKVYVQLFISLHIRSMWETICDAQAGLCTVTSDSKICVKILQRAPFWNFRPESLPPPQKWKTSDLRWPKFTPEYPPPMKNFRFEMTKVYSGIPPPNEKLQIWDDQSLLRNTPPPPQVAGGSSVCGDLYLSYG